MTEERQYERDLQRFVGDISDRPPKSQSLMISNAKTFLIENKVELPERFWRRLRGRMKGSRALTLNKVPSNQELKTTLTHMPIQGKALFLLLASSGMRIGEAILLKLDDLNLENHMAS